MTNETLTKRVTDEMYDSWLNQLQWFVENKSELESKYGKSEYLAVKDNVVVDHDANDVSLMSRVFGKNKYDRHDLLIMNCDSPIVDVFGKEKLN